MKKKTLVLFLAAAMACSVLTGCGNSSEETAPAVTDVSEGQTEEEPEELEDDAPCRSALRIIDTLSASLPPAQVFPALSENLSINICLKQILVLVVEHFLLLVLLWKEFLNTCNRMLRLLCGPLLKRD